MLDTLTASQPLPDLRCRGRQVSELRDELSYGFRIVFMYVSEQHGCSSNHLLDG